MKAYPIDRDIVDVAGPDAEAFLQGQLSQDVEGLEPGASALSFLLQPQGKVDALLRVSRLEAARFVLDVEAGFGPAVVTRLQRFKLRVEAELRPLEGWRGVAVLDGDFDARASHATIAAPGLLGVDLLGPEVEVPPGATLATAEDYERRRVEAGVPRMGREVDERTIPAETGLVAVAVSFTKGCYTGQELVARIDSRGDNVPRRLRRLVHLGGPPFSEGDDVVVDRSIAGRVTSAAGAFALAYVKRAIEVPAEATAGPARARIEALPPVV